MSKKFMTKIHPLIFIYFLLTLSTSTKADNDQSLFNLVLHSQERGGACLDGSPPGLYVHNGTGSDKNKFMLYFDSGGFCGAGSLSQTIQSCYRRSFTSLGTTTNYKPQKSFKGYGLLSPLQQENPVFYNWTKVFVIYCDGSEYAGHRETPISYKDRQLYFRGSRNVMQQFRYLDKVYDFYNGEKIVITGVSAGGMATYQWSNYLVKNSIKAKVYALPDSGFFITDFYSPIAKMQVIRQRAQNLLNLVNQKQQMPEPIQKCLQKPNLDIVDCFNSGNYAQFLTAPLFIIQSPYDAYSLENIVVIQCMQNTSPPFSLQKCDQDSMSYIEDYRKQTYQYLQKMRTNRSDVGLWSPSCVQHGFSDVPSFTDSRFQVNGTLLASAVQEFILDSSNAKWYRDGQPWPNNTGCNGIDNMQNLRKSRRNREVQMIY